MAKAEAVTLDTLLNDPRFQGIQDEAVKTELLNRFARKYPEAVRGLNAPVASPPVPTPTPAPAGPQPTPLPETTEWRSGIARPGGIMGALRHEREPGGMLSNEALLTEAAGMAVGIPPGARMGARLLRRGTAGLLGGSLGRASEFLQPGQMPESLGQAATETAEGGKRGALALAGGGMLSDVLGALGRRVLRPRGELSPEQLAANTERQTAGLLPRVSAVRGSHRAATMENVPRTVPFTSKRVGQRLKAEQAAEQKALLDMAEQVSPGATRDFEAVSATLRKGFTREHTAAKAAADNLFEHYKDIMETASPQGVYTATNLMRSAAKVVGTEAPLSPFATGALPKAHGILNQYGEQVGMKLRPGRTHGPVSQTVAEQLSIAGYDPTKVYNISELLRLTQRLGKAVAAQKDATTRAEMTHMWRAAMDDLDEAAVTAGVPEATTILNHARAFYKANIIEIFRNQRVLRTMVKQDPSEAAKTLFAPTTTVEQLRRVRNAVGDSDFNVVRGAWIKDLAERRAVSPTEGFDARTFLNKIVGEHGYSDAQLKELTGKSYGEFKTFLRAIQRQEEHTVGGEKYSLANAQLGSLAAAVGAMAFGAATGRPGAGMLAGAIGAGAALGPAELMGLVFYTDRGIRWLTVGLGSSPGSKKFIQATSALATIASQGAALAATRPPQEGEDVSGISVRRMFSGQ